MEPLNKELDLFVEKERARFEDDDNNKFAFAFSQVMRYYEFVTLIKERYDTLGREFHQNHALHKSLFPTGGGPITKDQAEWFRESRRLSTGIQLEIETYYLFSKILLDKVARFLEHYFGTERGLSLDSHDQLTKNIDAWCKSKGMTKCSEIQSTLRKLKKDIADFRDYQIAHEKSPRTVHGIAFSEGSHEVSMMMMKIQPKETEAQTQTKILSELQADVDTYLRTIMLFISANSDKTRFKIKSAV